jgi:ABC-type histidine transport system ATPase subunit
MEILKVENLCKGFGELKVLRNINQHVNMGEVVSIIGPSGSGKSTFLRCLNLLEVPDSEVALVRTELPKRMASVAQLAVPLLAEVGVGLNWDEAH